MSLLIENIEKGDLKAVKKLLELGFNNKEKSDALVYSAKNGLLRFVKLLLKNETHIHDNALIYSAEEGHYNVVDFLIKEGVFMHINALIFSAAQGHVKIVKLLLDSGMDVDNDSPLVMSASNGHLNVVTLLLSYGAKISGHAYISSIENNRFAITELFIKKDANVIFCNNFGMYHSASYGYTEMFELFIRYGANIHDDEQTLFEHSIDCGNLEIIKIMVENNCDICADKDYVLFYKFGEHRHITDYLLSLYSLEQFKELLNDEKNKDLIKKYILKGNLTDKFVIAYRDIGIDLYDLMEKEN